jgi:hypothetical protein
MLNRLLERELEVRRDQLLVLARQTVQGELARFDQMLLAKQQAIAGKLKLSDLGMGGLESPTLRDQLPQGILGQGVSEALRLRLH